MKKLLLVSAIVFGASSIASAQAVDIDPAASKAAPVKPKLATAATAKQQKELDAQAKLTTARPRLSAAATPATKQKRSIANKQKATAVKSN